MVMVTCTRCCLHKAMRIVNLLTTLLAVALIIYSLWLLNKWDAGVAHLPLVHNPPKPWFMYTCLLMGIAICLTTLSGQMIPNCAATSTLSIYIASIFSILILEVAAIVTVFYKINWSKEFTEYMDEKHQKFRSFVLSHLLLSRFILLFILIPQINVIILAVVLWGIGTEPTTHSHISEMPHFRHSFLEIWSARVGWKGPKGPKSTKVKDGQHWSKSTIGQQEQLPRQMCQIAAAIVGFPSSQRDVDFLRRAVRDLICRGKCVKMSWQLVSSRL